MIIGVTYKLFEYMKDKIVEIGIPLLDNMFKDPNYIYIPVTIEQFKYIIEGYDFSRPEIRMAHITFLVYDNQYRGTLCIF